MNRKRDLRLIKIGTVWLILTIANFFMKYDTIEIFLIMIAVILSWMYIDKEG